VGTLGTCVIHQPLCLELISQLVQAFGTGSRLVDGAVQLSELSDEVGEPIPCRDNPGPRDGRQDLTCQTTISPRNGRAFGTRSRHQVSSPLFVNVLDPLCGSSASFGYHGHPLLERGNAGLCGLEKACSLLLAVL